MKGQTKNIIISICIVAVLGGIFYYAQHKKGNTVPGKVETDASGQVKESPNVYHHYNPEFYFSRPASLKETVVNDNSGETVLLQSKELEFEMQIHISYIDDDTPVTIARIKKEVKDVVMEDPIEIKTDDVPTVAFYSTSGGKQYREIWFSYNGFLYQILAPRDKDNITSSIMQTWRFASR